MCFVKISGMRESHVSCSIWLQRKRRANFACIITQVLDYAQNLAKYTSICPQERKGDAFLQEIPSLRGGEARGDLWVPVPSNVSKKYICFYITGRYKFKMF